MRSNSVANTLFVVTKNISAENLANCSTSAHKVKKKIVLSKKDFTEY